MKNKIENLYEEARKSGGVISTSRIEDSGIGRYEIKSLVEHNILSKEGKGIYSLVSEAPEDYVVIQQRSNKIVFSYSTALFFHNLIDRAPINIEITIPQGYNASRIKKTYPNLKVHYVKKELLYIGIESLTTPLGSNITVYNKERCICDLIKDKNHIDKQIYIDAIKAYFSHIQNEHELIKISKLIGVEDEIRNYLEVI